MGRKYHEPRPGEWIIPVKNGYKMACCDCGLVHRLDFRTVKAMRIVGRFIHFKVGRGSVAFRVFRDNRATGQTRRKRGKR